jgi:hypothetical protein
MAEYIKRMFLPWHRPLCVDCKFYSEEPGLKGSWKYCTRSFGSDQYVGGDGPNGGRETFAWAQRDAFIGQCKPWAKGFEPKDSEVTQ